MKPIPKIQEQLLALYRANRRELEQLPEPDLRELLHQAEDLRNSQTFTERTAAEIVRTCCELILEERRQKA